MSRGNDFDERDDDRIGEEDRSVRDPGRTSGTAQQPERPSPELVRIERRAQGRGSLRTIEKLSRLSDRERRTLREIGRFRTIATDALTKHQYTGMAGAMRKEIARLQQHGLLQRRSISVGKKRNTLTIVALTKEGARLIREDPSLPEKQAVYAGFVKPAEVPHDAAIYEMYQAEAAEIQAKGGKIRRIVLDYEVKKEVYSKLVRVQDSGALEYARRQQEIAAEHRLPLVDGRIVLPDLRIEYENPEGDLDHVDLELATEHYHRGHMAVRARAGFKMYGFVSTSRGRRAKWEGRELSAAVLSL